MLIRIRRGDKVEEQGGVVLTIPQLARSIRMYMMQRKLLAVYLMTNGKDVPEKLRQLLPGVPIVAYKYDREQPDMILDLLADVFTLLRNSKALLGGVSSNLFRFAVQLTGKPFLDTDAITSLSSEEVYGPKGYWIQAHLCQCSAVRIVNGTVCVGNRNFGSRFNYCRTYGAAPGYCMQTAHYKLWRQQHTFLRWPKSSLFDQISRDGPL